MSAAERASRTAALVQRLAVLLEAGLAPLPSWRALAASSDAPPELAEAAGSAATAHDLPAELRRMAATAGDDWSGVAAALEVAGDAGAPLAPALHRVAAMLRDRADSEREVATALAGPLATTRVVLLLPVVGILFASLIGVDAMAVLVGTPIGWACLGSGALLMAVGALWMRRLVRSARGALADPGLEAELVAIAISGGITVDRARSLAARALDAHVADAHVSDSRVSAAPGRRRPAVRGDRADLIAPVLEFAVAAGVPAAALLRAEAEEARRTAGAEARRRAAVLGVRLLVPLGVCVLPAFVVLGVVPVIVSLVSSALGGWR